MVQTFVFLLCVFNTSLEIYLVDFLFVIWSYLNYNTLFVD